MIAETGIQNLKALCKYLPKLKKHIGDIDIQALKEHLFDIWKDPEHGIEDMGDFYALHTYGWSDNETIIEILENSYFWLLYWKMSMRGGHYYFEIPED